MNVKSILIDEVYVVVIFKSIEIHYYSMLAIQYLDSWINCSIEVPMPYTQPKPPSTKRQWWSLLSPYIDILIMYNFNC